MKTICFAVLCFCGILSVHAQTAQDLFRNEVPVTWLGIDYSHVTLTGNFSEFGEIGTKSTSQIIHAYFPKWNRIVLDECNKYDIRGMLRLSELEYDLTGVQEQNARTRPCELESGTAKKFTKTDIRAFVEQYDLGDKTGIGLLFIAESLNKCTEEALYHLVAINMKTREVLFHKKLRGEPSGFGLRNYWANSLYQVIKDIKNYYYFVWREEITGEKTCSVLELHMDW